MKIKSDYPKITASINIAGSIYNLMIRDTRGDRPKQICRSTKETNRTEAEKRAKIMLAELYGGETIDSTAVKSSQTGKKIVTVADMIQSYYDGQWLNEQIIKHPPEKIKKHKSSMNGRVTHYKSVYKIDLT